MVAERLDEGTEGWPTRPWIMAAVCAAAGWIFHWLIDLESPGRVGPLFQAAATFVAIATISFVITVEWRRWTWAAAFALAWGAVVALVGWTTASYNQQPTIFEFPFLSGIFAVMLAAPLFQTMRDEGARRFPYARLHGHAWTDAVIGAASMGFTGITFLMAWLIAGLFNLIGIDVLQDLLQEEWFAWMLAGFAFGGSVGLLRERDALLTTLRKLVMVVLSVLAPVLAVALVLFLASIPFTGLGKLWDSDIPATPLVLLAAAGAVLLANAIIGNGQEERSPSRLLQGSALALVAVVLPLAVIAALSMGIRIGQYGWTPERIWGVVAVGVAIAYGLAGWWAVFKGRREFDDPLRPLQTKLAIGLCGLALLLALPILDFGSISAKSQLARLESGKVAPGKFDWAAMAFDFGPEGRERLTEIANSGPAAQRELADLALKTDDRYALFRQTEIAEEKVDIEKRVRLLSPDIQWDDELRRRVAAVSDCQDEAQCALIRLSPDKLILLRTFGDSDPLLVSIVDLALPQADILRGDSSAAVDIADTDTTDIKGVSLAKGKVELRDVTVRQVYVDGKPVAEAVRITR